MVLQTFCNTWNIYIFTRHLRTRLASKSFPPFYFSSPRIRSFPLHWSNFLILYDDRKNRDINILIIFIIASNLSIQNQKLIFNIIHFRKILWWSSHIIWYDIIDRFDRLPETMNIPIVVFPSDYCGKVNTFLLYFKKSDNGLCYFFIKTCIKNHHIILSEKFQEFHAKFPDVYITKGILWFSTPRSLFIWRGL